MDTLSGLLLRARDGDPQALTDFVRATQAQVWRFCAHLVGPDDADEAVQETYVALWQAVPSFRGEASAWTWLFAIARRVAGRVSRRSNRWRELADQVQAAAPPPHPETAREPDELLSLLDLDRRTALVLTQVLGLSYAEAAVVCDCPIGTIRSRVARAREELLEHRSQTAMPRTGEQVKRA
jgi:RNA polymerase sigma-70 factor (ECF subfamily)